MRKPVSAKGQVVGKFIFSVFLRPDSWSVWPARSIVKAEGSEFILSLNSGRAGDIEATIYCGHGL
jgi:hypothetical protein